MWTASPNCGMRRPEHDDRNKDIGPRTIAPDYPGRTVMRAGRGMLPGGQIGGLQSPEMRHQANHKFAGLRASILVGVDDLTAIAAADGPHDLWGGRVLEELHRAVGKGHI